MDDAGKVLRRIAVLPTAVLRRIAVLLNAAVWFGKNLRKKSVHSKQRESKTTFGARKPNLGQGIFRRIIGF